MRRSRLLLYFAVALSGIIYFGGSAWAHMGCAVQLSVHPHATVFLWGRPIAHCVSGAAGCKCVSCWGPVSGVHAACYPLLGPIPH
jgi:hypothetical protein